MKFETKLKSYQRIKAQKNLNGAWHAQQSMRKLTVFEWRMQHPLRSNEVLPRVLESSKWSFLFPLCPSHFSLSSFWFSCLIFHSLTFMDK